MKITTSMHASPIDGVRDNFSNRCVGHFVVWLVLGVTVLSSCGTPTARPSVDNPSSPKPPQLILTSTYDDIYGKVQGHPLRSQESIDVLVFTTHDCPIANSYSPTLIRCMNRWSERGVSFGLIYVGTTTEEAREHHRAHGFPCDAFIDTDLVWAHALGVTHTPQCVVRESGRMRYSGRIDDVYKDYGKRANQPSRHDLEEALDELTRGEEVSVPRTQPVGCPLPTIGERRSGE